MMRAKLSFVGLVLMGSFILTNSLSAQVVNEAEISPSEMQSMLDADKIPTHRAISIEGSPYFVEDFYEGSVHLVNERVTRGVPIRYNTHEHSIDFMSANEVFSVGMDNIRSFEFLVNGETFKFSKGFEASGITEEDIVEVAAEGEAVFIIRHNTTLFEDTATYGVATQQNRYLTSETFYIKVGDDDFNRIRRPNKRRVIRSFPDFRDELEDFADQNNLDFASKAGIARITDYYNSLTD